jgi:arylsulfatase
LAREAIVYEDAWSTAPLTGPALSALLTGRPPETLGLTDNRTILAEEARTLAEVLREAGVATAAVVSNWVLRRRGELGDAGVQQGFAHFDDAMSSSEPSRPHMKERVAVDTTDAALTWLDRRPPDVPFFLWVHYQDPHGPYTAPQRFLAPVKAVGEAPLEVGADERGRDALPRYQVIDDERRPSAYHARYEAEIRYFDQELGRLLEGLRARGLYERVLLVFTADHGESLGERGYYFSHGQHLHRELLQVPLVLRPPGGVAPGQRVHTPVSHLDLFPTLLAALGLAPSAALGTNLLGGPPTEERVLPHSLRGTLAATNARHRLVLEPAGPRLYDRALDPDEEHDLAPQNQRLVRELLEGHRALFARADTRPLGAAEPLLDEEAQRAMEALGYTGDD